MVRAVDYGEADTIATLFTQSMGLVAVLARSARSAAPRSPGVLQPMHTLRFELAQRAGAELMSLRFVAIETARERLVSDLDRIQAAASALRWLRQTAPHHAPEPGLWKEIEQLLDLLDQEALRNSPCALLAEAGIRMLRHLGYQLSLQHCIKCGRACQKGRSAYVDPVRGGIVCRRCGGAGRLLSGATRERLAAAAEPGSDSELIAGDAPFALEIIDGALRSHAGVRD
jgi:DNA repair protein RecO (recombination protein O)